MIFSLVLHSYVHHIWAFKPSCMLLIVMYLLSFCKQSRQALFSVWCMFWSYLLHSHILQQWASNSINYLTFGPWAFAIIYSWSNGRDLHMYGSTCYLDKVTKILLFSSSLGEWWRLISLFPRLVYCFHCFRFWERKLYGNNVW